MARARAWGWRHACLSKVYRATMLDGREVAVKVQRPGALRQCLLDASVIVVALKAIEGRYWNGDLLAIFDTVAAGVVEEVRRGRGGSSKGDDWH